MGSNPTYSANMRTFDIKSLSTEDVTALIDLALKVHFELGKVKKKRRSYNLKQWELNLFGLASDVLDQCEKKSPKSIASNVEKVNKPITDHHENFDFEK